MAEIKQGMWVEIVNIDAPGTSWAAEHLGFKGKVADVRIASGKPYCVFSIEPYTDKAVWCSHVRPLDFKERYNNE